MQALKQNPIATQREACLAHAKQLGYEINDDTDIYIDDGISGRTDDRMAYIQMMERLKTDAAIEAIIAYDISRIFRNVVEYLNFKKQIDGYGKRFFSVTENFIEDTPAGWFSETMMAVFAEFRSRQDGEKIKRGMQHKVVSGVLPGKAPYGYKNVREHQSGDKDRRWIEVDENEGPWVTESFREFASGAYSLHDLTRKLREESFPTRNGKPLAVSTIEQILKYKLYIGYLSWGGVENPNSTQPKLTDEETFYKVQTILSTRNLGACRKRKHQFLLRGISYCGECGARITAGIHHKKNRTFSYYNCQKRIGGNKVFCSQPVFPLAEAEKQFAHLMKSIQISETATERLADRVRESAKKFQSNNHEIRTSLTKQLEETESRKKSLTEKYIDESIDRETYLTHKAELETKEAKCRTELGKIDSKLSSWKETTEMALTLIKNCYGAYQAANYDQKIALAHTIFERLTIKDRQIIEAKLKEPFNYLLKKRVSRNTVFK
jgi:DNA invertase Pin-like site-specific DNA recombinase